MKGRVALYITVIALFVLTGCTSGAKPVTSPKVSASSMASATSGGTATGGSNSNTNAAPPPGLTIKNGYPSHVPGVEDVSTMVRGQPFRATPNFSYFEKCGRPCWLPLYRSPRLIAGTTVTNNFPYERFAGNSGNALKVVCQFVAGTSLNIAQQLDDGYRLQNEHILSNGILEYSNLWDKVVVPDEALLPSHMPNLAGLEPTPDGQSHYVWGADIWLGNTGDHGIPCK